MLRTVLIALMMFAAAPASAGKFDDALAAYKRGDYSTAVSLWRELAAQGFPSSQHNLGTMYDKGRGIPQDYAEAAKWYRLAAEQGFPLSQTYLGAMCLDGRGVLQDCAEAAKWYRLAAKQGNAQAQNNLGAMYEYGDGVLQDNITAHMWFNIAGANSSDYGVTNRNVLAEIMTPADISEAQRRAKVCMNSNYQDCD